MTGLNNKVMCYGKLFSWQWQQEHHLYLPTCLHCVNFWYYKEEKKGEICACAHTHIKHTGLGDLANITCGAETNTDVRRHRDKEEN